MTHAMCLQSGGGGSFDVKDAIPSSKPHAVRSTPESSGGLRQCQQPHGPVHAYKGLSAEDESGSGTSDEREDVEAWEEVLDWRRSAAISTMRASSSEQGSLCGRGSVTGRVKGGSGTGACPPLAMLRCGRQPRLSAKARRRCANRLSKVSLRL